MPAIKEYEEARKTHGNILMVSDDHAVLAKRTTTLAGFRGPCIIMDLDRAYEVFRKLPPFKGGHPSTLEVATVMDVTDRRVYNLVYEGTIYPSGGIVQRGGGHEYLWSTADAFIDAAIGGITRAGGSPKAQRTAFAYLSRLLNQPATAESKPVASHPAHSQETLPAAHEVAADASHS